MNQEIRAWLDGYRPTFERNFRILAEDRDRFPGYARLSPSQTVELRAREWMGLCAFVLQDETELKATEDQHRVHASTMTPDISLEEQMAFLDERLWALEQDILADESTTPFREVMLRRLKLAASYYRVGINRIALEQIRTR